MSPAKHEDVFGDATERFSLNFSKEAGPITLRPSVEDVVDSRDGKAYSLFEMAMLHILCLYGSRCTLRTLVLPAPTGMPKVIAISSPLRPCPLCSMRVSASRSSVSK